MLAGIWGICFLVKPITVRRCKRAVRRARHADSTLAVSSFNRRFARGFDPAGDR